MSKSRIGRVILPLLILAAAGGGLWFYLQNGEAPQDQLRLYGNIDIRQVQLAFESSGRIENIRVEEGDRVSPGQLLAQIAPQRYQASVNQARAEVQAQKKVLDRMLAGSRPQEIAAARAQLAAAKAKLEEAEDNFARIRELAGTRFASEQKLDAARATLKSARAQVNAEAQALDLAVEGPRQEDIDAARARLEASEAALALAGEKLSDTKLFAPDNGIIRSRILEPGDMASPQKPVLTLALTNPLWVRAYVDETDLGKIAPGMAAQVKTDSYPDKRYQGWIGYISPTAEFTPKSVQTEALRSKLVYQVRVYVCNPQNELRLGMPATVIIDLDQERPSEPEKARAGQPCREQ
mgnify:CR=1 FL=1